MLTRHVEKAGRLLDPFLADPRIWELEFARAVSESSGLAASSEGIVEPGRRTWPLREVATWLVIHADAERVAELRSISERMTGAAVELSGNGSSRISWEGREEERDPPPGVPLVMIFNFAKSGYRRPATGSSRV
jgi:hypothetical protein